VNKLFVITIILVVITLLWLNRQAEKAIVECQSAGVQSDETCVKYTL